MPWCSSQNWRRSQGLWDSTGCRAHFHVQELGRECHGWVGGMEHSLGRQWQAAGGREGQGEAAQGHCRRKKFPDKVHNKLLNKSLHIWGSTERSSELCAIVTRVSAGGTLHDLLSSQPWNANYHGFLVLYILHRRLCQGQYSWRKSIGQSDGVSNFSHCCDQEPDVSNLRWFILNHSLVGCSLSIMTGEAWQWEPRAWKQRKGKTPNWPFPSPPCNSV